MSKFSHIKKNVKLNVYDQQITWMPPNWISNDGTPPPKLHLIRLSETNARFARAQANPRIETVRNRKDGKITESDLIIRRQRQIMLFVISQVVGWDDVFDEKGNKMPFPVIGEEPTDSGVREVMDLLAELGPEAELDFCMTCADKDQWVVDPTPEDDKTVVPLPKS